ncbi:MAG: DNA protecting protein DprA [Deltaproteobacteria bacterium RIFCSPHIGHO2_02_FULL_40_11]|nr:MAG: DNA protecting protein DprA [Deltaproteobacteria bacterium RIFCSPHIGHO2_02_FULL_40_11]
MFTNDLFYQVGLNFFHLSAQEIEKIKSDISGDWKETFECLNQKRDIPFLEQDILGEIEMAHSQGVKLLSFWDEAYPKLLKEIPDAPLLLYVKGHLPKTQLYLAVVGARRATAYGLDVTKMLCSKLATHDVCVVSGMALGIDGMAHRSTLEAGGWTIGVLGCGFGHIYPPGHRKLYEDVTRNGALISEFPWQTAPHAQNFPRRNRIISGLSKGVIVVEATFKSGSRITAKYALDQGRDVFCVPGRIDTPQAEGTHDLIQNGAKLISKVQDVLDEYPDFKLKDPLTHRSNFVQSLTVEQKKIIHTLDRPKDFNEILDETSFQPDHLTELLMTSELQGVIAQNKGQYVRRLQWPQP